MRFLQQIVKIHSDINKYISVAKMRFGSKNKYSSVRPTIQITPDIDISHIHKLFQTY